MIKSALIALGLSAGAAQGQGLVQTAPLLDTCGGTRLVLNAVGGDADDLEGAAGVVNARIGGAYSQIFDYVEVEGTQIVVSIPAAFQADVDTIAPLLNRVEFGFYDVERIFQIAQNVDIGEGQRLLPTSDRPETRLLLNGPPILDSTHLQTAEATFDYDNRPAIAFSFNGNGTAILAQHTSDNIGKPFAIVLDGAVLTAPVIQSPILGGDGIITGDFNPDETLRLAAVLQGGVLPFDLDITAHDVMDGSDPSADFCP